MKTIEGNIKITRSGAGFVDISNNESIRIESGRLKTALNRDKVVVSIEGNPEVLKVLERAKKQFTGTAEQENGKWFVIPDDKKIHLDFFIPKSGAEKLEPNKKVLVELVKWDNPEINPEAKVLEIIGEKGENETEMQSILLNRGIDFSFPENVEKEAKEINRKINQEEMGKRKDLRGSPTFTIDPVGGKDFDDAISFKKLSNGNYEIGVHIADVSHYVRSDTALDEEARERGFSVYLVDRTIPMLPEILSNDVCSLNPNEDKLVFSIVFEFDKNMKIQNHWIGRAIINSNKRFTYEEAQEILDKKKGQFYEELNTLNEFAQKMNKERVEAGSILFNRDEIKIEIDERGEPTKIYKKKRLDTHKLVEEFMLLANKKVTEHIEKHCKKKDLQELFVYRIHDLPDEEKLQELSVFLKAFGYHLNVEGGVNPKEINRLIREVEGKPEEELVKTTLIRSMAKAEYSVKNIGHFGLAFQFYTHFTSPIRRYADLLVHRLLEKHLGEQPVSRKELEKYRKLSFDVSEKEINAAEAERESKKYKTVEFMQDKIGNEFSAVIAGVTDWGLYVSLKETGAEGLVRLGSLKDDFYRADSKYSVQGEKTKKRFRLGDEVKVKLTRANLDQKELDFVFI
ncbi:MAG TPA: ribonuclease R [Candidatus Paceibacterota bacterium]|jgi:ribonuclease R|nr:ribonuclease R [Parcubacteria group bacterium]MDP6119474.1 ribonuclease R [Candidatus Paceibacterota bacterium]HJN62654.1 ribonuclease R [Candidatus Paceibacterota bacterium]|tara:strand:- start:4634 stop:6511 length:1878 start_codon:yes stop_codon:yes gene_type:complete